LENILNAAVKCLKAFLSEYHDAQRDSKIIVSFIDQAKSLSTSKSFTLALSRLTKDIYNHYVIFLIL
jgi:hypothetical protein